MHHLQVLVYAPDHVQALGFPPNQNPCLFICPHIRKKKKGARDVGVAFIANAFELNQAT